MQQLVEMLLFQKVLTNQLCQRLEEAVGKGKKYIRKKNIRKQIYFEEYVIEQYSFNLTLAIFDPNNSEHFNFKNLQNSFIKLLLI